MRKLQQLGFLVATLAFLTLTISAQVRPAPRKQPRAANVPSAPESERIIRDKYHYVSDEAAVTLAFDYGEYGQFGN